MDAPTDATYVRRVQQSTRGLGSSPNSMATTGDDRPFGSNVEGDLTREEQQ